MCEMKIGLPGKEGMTIYIMHATLNLGPGEALDIASVYVLLSVLRD